MTNDEIDDAARNIVDMCRDSEHGALELSDEEAIENVATALHLRILAARQDERDKTIEECAKVAGETVYAALMDHSRVIAEYVERMIRTHEPPPSEL